MKPKPLPPTFLVPLLPLTPFLGAPGLSLPSTPSWLSSPSLAGPMSSPSQLPKALSAGWRRAFRFSPPRNQVLAGTRDSLPVAGPAFPCVEDRTCSGGPAVFAQQSAATGARFLGGGRPREQPRPRVFLPVGCRLEPRKPPRADVSGDP